MKSNMRLVLISVVLLMAAMIVAPVAAADNTRFIHDGYTIFENEQNLDLSNLTYGDDTEVVALVSYVDDANPFGADKKAEDNRIAVPTGQTGGFELLESQVGSKYGIYYAICQSTLTKENSTEVKTVNIRKPDVAIDVTLTGDDKSDSLNEKSVSKDTPIAFKLTTKYVAAEAARTDAENKLDAVVKIEITTPGGAKTTILGDSGEKLKAIDLDKSRSWIQPIGLGDVEAGTYSAQAKWESPEGFSDYAENSNTVSFTVSTKKLTIESNKDNVVRGNSFVVTITGESKTNYWVYVKDASIAANKYPVILAGQSGVDKDRDVPSWITDGPEASGSPVTDASALVLTKADGKRPIEFTTNGTTDDSTFTLKVRLDDKTQNKYDTVKVKVEKGAVTVTAAGDQSYFLGEEITLSGTNTDSDDVYLFIKGSNLNDNGANLIDGTDVVNDKKESFVSESVETDDTWEYKWETADVNLDAGTYTIYAVSQPKDKSHISDAEYGTISISIKEAFVTAEASSKTVAKGDSLYIRGTAEGSPDDGVKIWVLGRNYFGPDTQTSLDGKKTFGAPAGQSVEDDGSYEYELSDTDDLSSGQYFVVVQHPMKNGFGIKSQAFDDDNDYIGVVNQINKNIEFKIDGSGSLQGSNAAEALMTALNSPNIDDTYVKLSFMVAEPRVTIDAIAEHSVGEKFTITGKTNLAVGDDLNIEVTSSSFKPTEKTQTTGVGGASGTVPVVAGDDENTWSFEVDTTTFQPDDYIVKVESIEADTVTNGGFTLVKATETVKPTETQVVEPTETTSTEPTETATAAEPTATPGFGAILALIGLGAVAVLVLRKD